MFISRSLRITASFSLFFALCVKKLSAEPLAATLPEAFIQSGFTFDNDHELRVPCINPETLRPQRIQHLSGKFDAIEARPTKTLEWVPIEPYGGMIQAIQTPNLTDAIELEFRENTQIKRLKKGQRSVGEISQVVLLEPKSRKIEITKWKWETGGKGAIIPISQSRIQCLLLPTSIHDTYRKLSPTFEKLPTYSISVLAEKCSKKIADHDCYKISYEREDEDGIENKGIDTTQWYAFNIPSAWRMRLDAWKRVLLFERTIPEGKKCDYAMILSTTNLGQQDGYYEMDSFREAEGLHKITEDGFYSANEITEMLSEINLNCE